MTKSHYVPFSATRIYRKDKSSPAPRQSGASGWSWLIGTVDRGGLLRSCLVDTLHDHKGNEMTPSQFWARYESMKSELRFWAGLRFQRLGLSNTW